MKLTDRLDGLQRRHPSAGFPIAVVFKYVDDQGGYLAALITYYAFVSLFPLLLLAATVLGIVLAGDPGAQQHILRSALAQFPVIGDQLQTPKGLSGGSGGVVVGIVGSLYGGLGVAQAVQNASNQVWRFARHARPNPFAARARSLLLLAVAGLAVLVSTGLSAIASGAGSSGMWVRILTTAATFVLNSAVFVFVFRASTARKLTSRDVLPGSLLAAVLLLLLQTFGTVYFQHVVKHASETNGVFALVLGLLALLYLASVALVLCAEVNTVRVDNLHPRSLMTPFVDDVDLTSADRRAYRSQATVQQAKGGEQVEVTFGAPSGPQE